MSAEKGTRRYQLRKRADAMQDTRRRITEAAVELHGSVGPARTTLSAVAERAGVQRQTVYRHFPTDDDLFDACSGHFAASHPLPDLEAWRAVADPAERLGVALDELYAYYEGTEAMYANLLRDASLVAPVESRLAPFRSFLDDAAHVLAAGWGARGGRQTLILAAARHAVDFHTWHSLARDGGVRRAGVVELASAMVGRAARGAS
jgi:AcrR family transcriptional regulator